MSSKCRNIAYLKSENGKNGRFGHILDFFTNLSLEIGPWKWAGHIRLNWETFHIFPTRWRINGQGLTNFSYGDYIYK